MGDGNGNDIAMLWEMEMVTIQLCGGRWEYGNGNDMVKWWEVEMVMIRSCGGRWNDNNMVMWWEMEVVDAFEEKPFGRP